MVAHIALDTGQLRLDPDFNKTAAGEQAVAVQAGDRGRQVWLRFQVNGAPGDAIELTIGTTSGGDEVLCGHYISGWHIATFRLPFATTIYIRFTKRGGWPSWIDNVELLDGVPIELPTPWAEGNLDDLTMAQSRDVLTVCDGRHWPREIARTAVDAFSIELFPALDGPYLDENPDDEFTLDPDAADGDHVTVSAPVGADLFRPDDLYRHITIRYVDDDDNAHWGWGIIREYIDRRRVKVEVYREFKGRPDDTYEDSEETNPENPNSPNNPVSPNNPNSPNNPISPNAPLNPNSPNHPHSPNNPNSPTHPNSPNNPNSPTGHGGHI